MNYHSLSISQVQELLNTSQQGLSHENAQNRLKEYGRNELVDKHRISFLTLLIHQFQDIMIFILITAAVVSAVVGDVKEAVFILIIVLLNAFIGFFQEYKAEKAMEALKKMAAFNATVRRNGSIEQIPSSQLVPGDVVILEAGMSVPADIRLTEVYALKVEEASLTGESSTIEKKIEEINFTNTPLGDRFNMVYKTTVVTYGRGEGVVVATGMQTEIGRIAQLLQDKEDKTPLQKRLILFGKKLSMVVIGICVAIFGVGLLRGENAVQMLLTAISVAVAAIPEALPAVITITLALGASRLIRKNVLIRKLPAVETLGSVTYICSDKTGTITQNKMTVVNTWLASDVEPIQGFSPEQLLLLSMELNHDVVVDSNHQLKGDPTEVALVEYTRNANSQSKQWPLQFKRSNELPFDSVRKRMTTIHPLADNWLIVCKGAVENIVNCCTGVNSETVYSATEEFAKQGKRVLAYALKVVKTLPDTITIDSVEVDLRFIGLVAMMDPPRPEVIQAITDCHTAGVTPVMITGDHPATAKAIAYQTGILKNLTDIVMTGAELEKLPPDEFAKEIENIKVYARVSPEQKLSIVKALQDKQHFVAMTGDGVNDAPALRRADIGVAMGITGTDVSKEAAHMILLDDNFATIIRSIQEGRRIFDNIRKFIKYIMTSNSGEVLTIFLAPLVGLSIPLVPIQLLWLNLVTDGLPGLAFASEPAEENILKRPPRKLNENILTKELAFHMLWVGLLVGAISIGIQTWAIYAGNIKWQTMIFTVLSISQMGHAMAIRSDKESLFKQGILGNKQLLGAVLLTLGLQMAVVYVPVLQEIFHTHSLSIAELSICLGLSTIVFWAVEIEKWIKRQRK
ncbi:MAG: cation-translocating P-type ATPase [Cytophagales bacterium]|nr:MAG: cation-translocating P-type ATPase [Cytophagales bacterium]TAF60563.1 MAG: cation-translocating P-type ATPase [Cytophagales bacterium]